MKIGIILLSWVSVIIVSILALMASGMISVQIEMSKKDKDQDDPEKKNS